MQRSKEEILASQLEAVAGPAARFADHAVGEEIVYRVSQHETRTGVILHIAAPQQVLSQHVPLSYIIDAGLGFPDIAYATDIVYEP